MVESRDLNLGFLTLNSVFFLPTYSFSELLTFVESLTLFKLFTYSLSHLIPQSKSMRQVEHVILSKFCR